ncbi:MAG: exo-alpha-sialidase [Chloroflexi bacterium]|nr:exo-alpha-sialidase [Chloroflexota bacterium]
MTRGRWVRRFASRNGLLLGLVAAVALAAAALAAALLSGSRPPAGRGGPTLYTPDRARYPTASANYTWTVRLAQSRSANGRIIAAHDNGLNYGTDGSSEPLGIHLYRSDDDGQTWSDLPILADARHGWQLYQPALLELPISIGDGANILPAGTILLSALALGPAPHGLPSPFGAELEVYASADLGATWTYISPCDSIPDSIQVFGAGLWEPTLSLDRANRLICFFSDERFGKSTGGPDGTGHVSQSISHRVSADGGRTWGSEVFDVAVGDGTQRPGMPQVIRLPDGMFMMVYEVCGQPDCQVRFRMSADGAGWGAETDLGTSIASSDGMQPGHTPYVTWSPAGGPNGVLFVSSMHVSNGYGAKQPESGRVIFTNTNLGRGTWTRVAAPLTIGFGTGECPGWRQALEVSRSGTALLQLAPVALNHGSACEIRFATGAIGG